ncbi:MAG: 3-oxoacyl-(Acyl-carrier protein) reductase [Microgenomates group bacterium GW2011_GWA2_37_6]|nr:MAG: 3-oxoacyl-(Acyl-carrier protein) reductase [Microgenomates group bacterium GW2011_GWA2_37_6]
MDLENKTVLITGSSKGIGEAIAYAFAREKAKIVITYNSDSEGAKKVREKCLELGSNGVLILNLNIKDNASIKNAVSEVEKKFGHIDFLINNAGIISWEKFGGESFEEIENQIRTNLEGLIKITSAALPQIKTGVINIASRAGHIPFTGRSVYTASKFGVIGFTKALALEYPDLKIFTVSPGAVKTEMWNFESGTDPNVVGEYIIKAVKGEIPLKDGDLNVWELVE